MLRIEDMRVHVRDPLLAVLGQAQVDQRVLDESGVEIARAHRKTIGQYMDDAQAELNKFLGSQ